MYGLISKPGPVTKELLAAQEGREAVTVSFNPQPSPMSLRIARRKVSEILRDGQPEELDRAADAFSAALVRYNITGWTGLVNEAGEPVVPTHDVVTPGEDGAPDTIEPGTISAFLSDPRLLEAADREYVLPWTKLDAEKNGFAPSLAGTSARATAEQDIAGSTATPPAPGAAKRARTSSTKRKRTPGKRSGS